MLLTQNVDDLHSRAEWEGQRLAPEKIVQIHGDIFVTKCSRCSFALRATSENQLAATCPNCGAMLRPGVVWFDEELDPNEVHRIKEFNSAGPCDVVLVIGPTASFDYIVRWSLVAKGANGRLIEINPEETPMTTFATQIIHTPAALSLPPLVERLVA
jgi:NAD-dependent deacetylase